MGTREALEHFCPFVDLCVQEGLLKRMSCPISTKNARKHIRGYLAYLEAINVDSAERVLELYHEYNRNHMLSNGETVFPGISLNPTSTRPKREQPVVFGA